MKTRIVFIIGLLLLCVSCNVEQRHHLSYEGGGGGNEYRMLEVRMPENWKIVNAQLETKQVNLELDRGNGIEKQSLLLPWPIKDLNENMKFRGANRLDGLTLLHFSIEEDPHSEFNPPIGTTKISSGIKEREEFAIFRTSNWLVIHYSIKNTVLGELTFHDLAKRYAKNPNNKGSIASFETIDGKMHYNLVFNNKEKRSFLIDGYYGQHETYDGRSVGRSKSNNELSWTWRYKVVSNEKKIISNQVLDR